MNEKKRLINESAQWNNNVKTEPNDVCETHIIEPENITIKTEITAHSQQTNECNSAVILSTEKVIIKEELNIDEILYDEHLDEIDPLLDIETPTQKLKLECEICGANFTQSRQLDNHLFIMHRPVTVNGTGAYCNKCNKWFPEIKYPNHNPCFSYMRSIQNGKKMHSCEICDKDFTAISLLKVHLVECHRPLTHDLCVDFNEVLRKKIVCKICGAVFPLKRALMQHLTLMHRPYTFNSRDGAYCTRCQSWFAEERFKDHRPCVSPVQRVMPVLACNICNATFKMVHLFKMHMFVIHRPLTLQYCSDAFCDKCNRWFKEDNYAMHKCFRLSNNNNNNNNNNYSCSICTKTFVNGANLKKHLYNIHRPIIPVAAVVADFFDKVFCDFCAKFYDEDIFEGHVPCHSVDSKCMFCLITMPSKEHYLLHDFMWKGWRSYKCIICDLNTEHMRLANLNEHMISHGKKSIFRCVKCKFDFASMENTEAHIETVHFGCRCVVDPCECSTYNYDYYYEFVKRRSITDFGENGVKLENDIIKIREEQYKSIEANIEVEHMKKKANKLEHRYTNIFDCQDEYFSMPSTSKSTTSTIMGDFSSIPPGTSKVIDNLQLRVNYRQQEITPKTEYEFDNEDPDEKRKRLNREKQRRWRERQRKERSEAEKKNTIFLKEETITIEDDESSQETNFNQTEEDLEDPIEKKKRLNREKQQRWRQRRSEALDRLWEEKLEKHIPETVDRQNDEDHQNDDEEEDPQLRKKRLGRERQSRWRNKKSDEAEQLLKVDAGRRARKRTHETFNEVDMRRKGNKKMQVRQQTSYEIPQKGEESETRRTIDAAVQDARRTGQQSDEEIRRTARRIANNIPRQSQAKRRTIQTMNEQQLSSSSQSENSLDEFFDMIIDRWT